MVENEKMARIEFTPFFDIRWQANLGIDLIPG
jgi:hypothetical protein